MTSADGDVRSHPVRFWIALVVWLLCLPGLYFHVVVFGFTALGGLMSGDWLNASDLIEIVLLPLILLSTLSWLALAKMTVDWIEDRTAHWAWPVVGTALTLPVMVPTYFVAAFFVLPGVLLAMFLCFWHLRGWYRQREQASFAQR